MHVFHSLGKQMELRLLGWVVSSVNCTARHNIFQEITTSMLQGSNSEDQDQNSR